MLDPHACLSSDKRITPFAAQNRSYLVASFLNRSECFQFLGSSVTNTTTEDASVTNRVDFYKIGYSTYLRAPYRTLVEPLSLYWTPADPYLAGGQSHFWASIHTQVVIYLS